MWVSESGSKLWFWSDRFKWISPRPRFLMGPKVVSFRFHSYSTMDSSRIAITVFLLIHICTGYASKWISMHFQFLLFFDISRLSHFIFVWFKMDFKDNFLFILQIINHFFSSLSFSLVFTFFRNIGSLQINELFFKVFINWKTNIAF